jgi:two-component system cell cycle sensor histidine kinase/response regulator CckA
MKENDLSLTELKHLKDTEFLEQVLDNAQLGIVITDTEYKLKYVNPEFTRIFGYSGEEAIGKTIYDLIYLEERLGELEQVSERVRRKERNEFETIRRTKDGRRIHVLCRVSPIVVNGESVGGFAFYSDISEQKRSQEELQKAHDELETRIESRTRELREANKKLKSEIREREHIEKELRKSEKRWRTLFEQSIDAIIVHENGRIKEANNRACEILGYSKEQLQTMNVLDLHRDSDREEIEKIVGRKEKLLQFETQWIKADRTPVDVEISSNIIDLKKRLTQAIIRDITDRKRTEEALRESEEGYRTAIENSNDGVMIIQGRRYIYVNQKCADIYGYESPDEIVGKSDIQLIHPDDSQWVSELGRRRLEGELPSQRYEHKGIRKDGSPIHVEVSVAKTIYKGEAASLIYTRDVTDRKKAEEERKELEAKLQRARRLEAIGTLAGGVAHDLNNILSGIVSYPALLLMDLPQDSPLREPILTIKQSGEKAAAIVQDLLTLARRGVSAAEVVNVNQLVSEYLKSPEYEKLKTYHPHVTTETRFEKELLNISASPIHLAKTIMNLVSNAAEAMPEGGRMTISTENLYIDSPIKHKGLDAGEYVVLSVSDTGMGISPDDMERIFEPFFTKKAMGRNGTGLGMAVVWGTVKDLDGHIDVQSQIDKGTTFTLYFPATRKKAEKDRSELSIEDYMGRGESILVVDDVEEQREIASRILERLGYSAISVPSGEEAVVYLQDHSVDLIILDMIMAPGMDGLETYQRILESHPGQKAIIASGFSETDRVKEALKLGAGACVRKPYLLERIGVAVREELDRPSV